MAVNGPETTFDSPATSDGAPPDDAPGAVEASAGRRGRGLTVVLAVVAVLGLVGTIGFAAAWNGARSRNDGEAAMKGSARDFLAALTNFDAATVDDDFARVTSFATGDFRKQTDQFFGTDIRKALKERQASSRGEIRDLYVQSFSGKQGRVFAVVDQTIANNQFRTPEADELRVDLGLTLVNGTWKVFDVRVLQAPQTPASTPAVNPAATATTTTR